MSALFIPSLCIEQTNERPLLATSTYPQTFFISFLFEIYWLEIGFRSQRPKLVRGHALDTSGCSYNKRWPLIMNGTPTLFYIVLNGKAWDFITFMCGYDLYGSNWWWSAKILCIKLTRDNITVGIPDHHLFYWFGFNQTS